MANNINTFVDNMQLGIANSLPHLLHSENNEELNKIRHSPHSYNVDHCLSIHYKYIYKRSAFISKAMSIYGHSNLEYHI